MDNLTHGLAGALLAQAGFRQCYGPAATVALVVGSELPDFDFLFELGGPVTSFINHRGITHSLLGGAALALLGAAVLWGFLYTWCRRAGQEVPLSYGRMAALVYLGVGLHIWMDYLTSYGTQVFLPFDAGRYTADAVFIIDFFYTGIIITALLLIRMVRRQRQQRYGRLSLLLLVCGSALWLSASALTQGALMLLALQAFGLHLAFFAIVMALATRLGRAWPASYAVVCGRWGTIALAAYMALCIANHAVAKSRLAQALGPQAARVQRLAALPLPGNPLAWRGIAETPDTYLVGHITLFPAAITPLEVIPKQAHNPIIQTTSAYRLVHVFWNFARFPVIDYYEQDTEKIVRYFDLRFSGYGRQHSWFDLTIHLDPAGQVKVIEFLDHLFPPGHPDF